MSATSMVRLRAVAALAVVGLAVIATTTGCGSSKKVTPSGYDAIIDAAPVAQASAITSGSWMDQIKRRGYLKMGGTDTGQVFSLRDPITGELRGFDAGLAEMLARYITGKSDVKNLVKLTITTVDTRETLLQNGTVDAVFATYTITPARAKKVAFAGPYYSSGDAIMVKKDNTSINTVADLDGKNVATESNSTGALALKKYAPGAKPLLFQTDEECVAAVQQGRADAYVLDQSILISDASANKAVKVVGQPFTQEPYGIGLPLNSPEAKAFVNAWLQKIYDDGSWAKLWKATVGTIVSGAVPAPPKIGSVEGS
jgi:glutamate transport system substrate-binding protein